VDHPLAAPDALVRPWRTAAYVAVAIAAVELLLLLLIGGGKVLGWASDRMQLAARDHVLQPATQPRHTKGAAGTHSAPPAATRPRSKTTVLVLNGNGRTGAAAAAASRVHARGYRIGTVTNAPARVPRSIVMYRPGFAGEGRRLGSDLGVKLVTPLDGMRAKDLGSSQVVFILGP
jgi:LytR cell envelope-related transcriptional attenuator